MTALLKYFDILAHILKSAEILFLYRLASSDNANITYWDSVYNIKMLYELFMPDYCLANIYIAI